MITIAQITALAHECANETFETCYTFNHPTQDVREWAVAGGDLEALQDLVDKDDPDYDEWEQLFVEEFTWRLSEIADELEEEDTNE